MLNTHKINKMILEGQINVGLMNLFADYSTIRFNERGKYPSKFNDFAFEFILKYHQEETLKAFKRFLETEVSIIRREYVSSLFNDATNPNHDKTIETKSEFESKESHFHYIPFNVLGFINLINITKQYNKKNFLDVGCGTGSKLILAETFGDFKKVSGIEYNRFTYNIAERLVLFQHNTKSNRDMTLGDALTYKNYNKHDYIYMYQPMWNSKKMLELYEKILTDCEIGTLIVNVMAFDTVFRLDGFVFKYKNGVEVSTDVNNQPHYDFVLIKTDENRFVVEKLRRIKT